VQVNDLARHLQRTIGNRATARLLQSGWAMSPHTNIQRKIDPDLVEKHKEALGIPDADVRILEVPPKKQLFEKVSTLSEENKLNVADLNGLEFGRVFAPAYYEQADEDWRKSTANDILDGQGGAAYNPVYNVVVMLEGAMANPQGKRDLLHELGHFKQNINGIDFNNVNVKIIEYHNVLLNENKFIDEDGKNNLRLQYSKNPFGPKKSLEELKGLLTELGKAKELELIAEIEAELETDKYKVKDEYDKNGRTKAEIVKQNIVYETWTPFAEEMKQKAQLKSE
jgi:hypothetical protein